MISFSSLLGAAQQMLFDERNIRTYQLPTPVHDADNGNDIAGV